MEKDLYYFYLLDKHNNRYISLRSSHDNKDTLYHFYPLILNDIYKSDKLKTEMQCILSENNININDNFIVVVLDSNRNIINKVELSYPDKINYIN